MRFQMSLPGQRSLHTIVFWQEATLLCLVILIALIGGSSAYFWKYSATESLRIHALSTLSEQIRSELYAQVQEAFRTRILEDPEALAVYIEHGKRIERHFNALRSQSGTRQEGEAIQAMQRAYREIQQDMNRISRDPYHAGRPARMRILGAEAAQRMLGHFEAQHRQFKSLLDDEHHHLDRILYHWTRSAPVFIPLVICFACFLVWLTRRTIRRAFMVPMSVILQGARTLSKGRLEHRIAEAGVQELADLAVTLNGMAADLKKSRDALVESERQAALGALVPVVAHNIRNPLASIRATAQLIDSDDSTDELLTARHAILTTTDRLDRWVNALVSYLHPLQARLRPVLASTLLGAALEMVSERLQIKAIRVCREQWQYDRELMADPDLMEQALYALLQNAVDASPEGGILRLKMVLMEGYLELHIIDSGPGLPFKPTPGRLEPGPSTKRYGTGLGIPIAFRICQTHGWNIQFSDVAGGGGEVIVAAPLSRIPDRAAPRPRCLATEEGGV